MKCPSCGWFFDDKASDHDGPECPPCAEEMMASDEIGKGDTISREQAIAALLRSQFTHDDTYAYTVAALRSLPSIAPDPIEAEYREAAQAHGEADIEFELCACDPRDDCPHWKAMVLTTERLLAARAARDGAR